MALWLAIAGQSGIAAAQVPQKARDATATNESADTTTHIVMDPDLKKNAVWLAFMMWAGIIFGGMILLVLVVMWGNRTRRLARSPLPPVANRDPLWFLKPKPPADEGGTTKSDSGDNSRT
jgi:hypothetical protein